MLDKLNRKIDYLRISVIDRCNLRCVYCMPEEGIESIPHDEILTYDEILRICEIVSELGIRKIKITGGEPLVRKDIVNLIRDIKNIDKIEQVTLTTNGILLHEMLDDLYDAGIDAINISLDTLNKDNFKKITRRDGLEKVLMSIDKAYDLGIRVKINCLAIRDFNLREIVEIASFAKDREIDVRFIELMPIGFGKKYTQIDNDEILSILESRFGTFEIVTEKRGNGPAKYYRNQNMKGCIGFISAISHEFCESCNRIRLTSSGFLKLCLHYNKGIDLKGPIRNGISDEDLKKLIHNTIWNKPISHKFGHANGEQDIELKNMVQIGG
ncbi:GTP 3',8-cyclase MoaA [Intestinibacter bartlettii]|uniref:GTP 3',8-cyclase n=1 Tax=Intestinibacter bartlettii CAG:1329 TaxID=1263063 RepID=R5X756_9FIRM|nr:GTP 3',8-cyclase MoaA [Intestinibacter bartlettii]CDA10625.1 molybdenum cofactor biosynthesis protein A [Intestinibacter bartlettii CAG:1329]